MKKAYFSFYRGGMSVRALNSFVCGLLATDRKDINLATLISSISIIVCLQLWLLLCGSLTLDRREQL